MSWDANFFQATLIAGLLVVVGCIALLMDYLKSYNDQLRERNIDLAARQQERDRWFGGNPEAFVEKIAAVLRTAQGMPPLPATTPAVTAVSARTRHRAASYGPPAAAPVPVDLDAGEGLETESDSAQPSPPPSGDRRPRARARREPEPVQSWVSKEELEKLAERAARIRARYGTMIGEEAADGSPTGDGALNAGPDEGSGEDLPPSPRSQQLNLTGPQRSGEERDGEARNTESQEAFPETGMPAAGTASEWTAEPGSAEGFAGGDSGVSEAEGEAPVWELPSNPAQSAVTAAVSRREIRGAAIAAAPLEQAPPAASPQAPASLSSVPAYPASGTGASQPVSLAGGQHDADLDALFDQTYGSPSWLTMNGQEHAAAADSALPTGLFEESEFSKLMAEAPSFTGVAVSIRINDFAVVKPKLNSVEGVEAMSAFSNLIRSLLREDRDFAGRAQEDEYVLLFPGDIGEDGQRRLFHLSERLWDFQLRSLGGLALMLSWGGLEVEGQSVPEAVSAARDRLEESRRGRTKPGSAFRNARRVS